MKGKQVQVEDLIIGKEYWVEHSGSGWRKEFKQKDGVYVYTFAKDVTGNVLDNGETYIEFNSPYKSNDLNMSITIFEME